MSFSDIFKSSFLENIQSFSFLDMVIALVFAGAIGLFVMLIYKKTFTGVMYSTGFAVSLLELTMITTLVILAVTSNVVLSLGMVGALSIVRFRTAIKEPMEIVFLFWAIAVGIVIGAGMIPLAVLGSVVIGVVLLIAANRKTRDCPYMLIVRCADEAAEQQAADIARSAAAVTVKAKTVQADGIEWTAELRLPVNAAGETGFVNQIQQVAGVRSAVLVSYNGEYLG